MRVAATPPRLDAWLILRRVSRTKPLAASTAVASLSATRGALSMRDDRRIGKPRRQAAPPIPCAVVASVRHPMARRATRRGQAAPSQSRLLLMPLTRSIHARRSPPAIRFRDVDTPDWLWPVAPGVDACAEVLEVGLQVLFVVPHRDPIDFRTRLPLLRRGLSLDKRIGIKESESRRERNERIRKLG